MVRDGGKLKPDVRHAAERKKAILDLKRVAWIELPTFSDPARGNLTVIESKQGIPFAIARVFFIRGVPKDCERGAHAHRRTEQLLIAIAGSFFLDLTNASQDRTFRLREPHRAIYVPPMIWARLRDFSTGAVCLVLASAPYDPTDYIRDWREYVSTVANSSQRKNLAPA